MNVVSSTILKLVLIALFGWVLYKRKFVDDKILNFLTFFVINFTIPFLIFSHLIENLKIDTRPSLIIFLILSTILFIVGFVVAFIFSFWQKDYFRREFIALVSFQNSGYLPMNIAFFLFPSNIKETFFTYIFLYLLGFNIIMWSIGSFFIFKKRGEIFKLKSLFTPPIISIIFALLLVYTGASKFFPNFLLIPIKMIGNLSFVLSMIILGCFLAEIRLEGFSKRIFIIFNVVLLRLFVVPLIFLILIIKFKIFSLLGMFIILEASMPSAVSLPIVGNLRKADSEFISQGVLVTHVFSIFTIPLWLDFYLKVSNFNF
jgi:hypothetical protein